LGQNAPPRASFLTLGLLMMSYLTRMTRSTMLDVLGAITYERRMPKA